MMKRREVASSNVTFSLLKKNHEFLNALINDIGSCILILNKKMELRAFNEPLKNLFSNFEGEAMLYMKCGEALGCAHAVEEMKECGQTTHCKHCEIRRDALFAYTSGDAVFNRPISREFYTADGKKVLKHLRYSIRSFRHNRGQYIMVIVNDVTQLMNQTKIIREQEMRITELQSKYSNN
ncbi:MAG: hypothetical protein K9H26_05720 [Prolixibacteraceae bacterium]|nr:hypothetical protein [Prolixibacteraceae bacterium]